MAGRSRSACLFTLDSVCRSVVCVDDVYPSASRACPTGVKPDSNARWCALDFST